MPWVFALVATMYSSMMVLQTTNVDTVIGFRCLSPLCAYVVRPSVEPRLICVTVCGILL
jgi:hypothetical protein